MSGRGCFKCGGCEYLLCAAAVVLYTFSDLDVPSQSATRLPSAQKPLRSGTQISAEPSRSKKLVLTDLDCLLAATTVHKSFAMSLSHQLNPS